MKRIVIGTRQSALAMWQTHHIIELLKAAHPHLAIDILPFSTRGDELLDQSLPAIGGKGVFTERLEHALRTGQIDYAVHSLKDLPVTQPTDLAIGAIPPRGDVRDVLISKTQQTLDQLPHGAVIGTSSRRRMAQLLAYRRDLVCINIRGNVNTRIEKALASDSPYQAIVLAKVGVERLGLSHHIAQILPLDWMLPAPGQGALAVQCRTDEPCIRILQPLVDPATTLCVTAERAFLSALGGGCGLPVAAYATLHGDSLHLRGRVCAIDGSQRIDVSGSADRQNSQQLAIDLAHQALSLGATQLWSDL